MKTGNLGQSVRLLVAQEIDSGKRWNQDNCGPNIELAILVRANQPGKTGEVGLHAVERVEMVVKRGLATPATEKANEVILFGATWALVGQTSKIGVHGIRGKDVRNRAAWA